MKKMILFLIPFLLISCSKKTDSQEKPSVGSTAPAPVLEDDSVTFQSIRLLAIAGLPYLSISGEFGKDFLFINPLFQINSNQDGKTEAIEKEPETDGNDFSVRIPLSGMSYSNTWYNIYLIPVQEEPSSRLPININTLSVSPLYDTLSLNKSDRIDYVYSFEEYNNNLKVLFQKKDKKKTIFSSMNYEIIKKDSRQELYFHLRGYNEHTNLRLRLVGKTIRESNEASLGEFDLCVRVDDLLKKKSDPYSVSVVYQLSDGTDWKESITSKNLSNHSDLEGVSFKGDIYVFRAEKIGKGIYYSLSFNSDTFSMDTLVLYRSTGATLYFSGSSHYYPEGNYYLHIEKANEGKDAIILIPRNFISLSGYIKFSTRLNNIQFPEEDMDEFSGRLSVYHDNILLNYFWPETWSHRQDRLEKIDDDEYEYEIKDDNSKSNYCLKKRKVHQK